MSFNFGAKKSHECCMVAINSNSFLIFVEILVGGSSWAYSSRVGVSVFHPSNIHFQYLLDRNSSFCLKIRLSIQIMEEPASHLKYDKYKRLVKIWEREFKQKNGRTPSKVRANV